MAGHDVTIIASLVSFSEKGKPIILPGESIYETQEGCRVYRVDYKRPFLFFLIDCWEDIINCNLC